MLAKLAYSLLRGLPPELAHDLALFGMKRRWFLPDPLFFKPVTLFGHRLNNCVGLAAGFDKNGDLVDHVCYYGFGFSEIGSVTLQGGEGNPKPRLFRIPYHCLLNRMGLNGKPAHFVASHLERCESPFYGVSIARTNDPFLSGDAEVADVVGCFNLLKYYGMYTVVNLSCPNSKDGQLLDRNLQVTKNLLQGITQVRTPKPLLVKLSPQWLEQFQQLEQLIQYCKSLGINGYVLCNTLLQSHPDYGQGGLSGPFLKILVLQLIRHVKSFHPSAVILGVGGLQTYQDFSDYMAVGADAVQVLTGFVVGPHAGPSFVNHILRD